MKTELKNNLESVIEYLEGLSDSELLAIYGEYCQSINDSDNEIFYNDEEFFTTYFSNVMDAVRAISYGEYAYSHEYVKFNGYANLESFDNLSANIDLSDIANDILENPENYYGIELEEEEEIEEETEEEED
jgi:hypothetical protein